MTGFWTPEEAAQVDELVKRGYREPQLRHLVVKHGESVSMLLALARQVHPAVLVELLDSGTQAVDALQFLSLSEARTTRIADLRRLAAMSVPLSAAACLLDTGAPLSEVIALHVLGADLWVAVRMWDQLGACTLEVRQAAISIASCPDPVSDGEAIAAAKALYPPPAAWTLDQSRRVRALGASFEQAADLQQMRLAAADAAVLLAADSPDAVIALLATGARPEELLALSPLSRHSVDRLARAFAQLDESCQRDEFVTFVSDGLDPLAALSAARANESLERQPVRVARRVADPAVGSPRVV